MLTLMYSAFAVAGGGYVLLSALLGHGGGGGHVHVHHSAGEHYGLDGKGHGSTSAGQGAEAFHFPFVSPLAIATLLAAVGMFGLAAEYGLHVTDPVSLLIALPAAFLTAYGITYAGWRLASGSSGTSVLRLSRFPGAEAEVTVPIPAGGVGEAVAMVDGQRYAAPAREAGGREVARGMPVTVVEMVGPTLIVTVDLLIPANADGNERGSGA